MNRLFPTFLFSIILLFCPSIFAQTPTPYSESKPYSPLLVEPPKATTDKNAQKIEVRPAAADPVATILANTTVTIPVSVLTRTGELVGGLQPSEFKVFVDNNEAEIVSVKARIDPITVVLVLDMSPSSRKYLETIKSLASRLVGKLRSEDKVMIVRFNMDMKVVVEPTTDRKVVEKAVREMEVSNGTSVFQTISELYEKTLASVTEPSSVILFTDGVDTSSQTTYQKSLAAVEKGTAPVFPIYLNTYDPAGDPAVIIPKIDSNVRSGAVTFGVPSTIIAQPRSSGPATMSGLSKQEHAFGKIYLTELLKASGGRPVMVDDLQSGKTSEFDNIPQELLSRYYITIRLNGSRRAGDRRAIKIRVNKPDLKVLAKGSYIEK